MEDSPKVWHSPWKAFVTSCSEKSSTVRDTWTDRWNQALTLVMFPNPVGKPDYTHPCPGLVLPPTQTQQLQRHVMRHCRPVLILKGDNYIFSGILSLLDCIGIHRCSRTNGCVPGERFLCFATWLLHNLPGDWFLLFTLALPEPDPWASWSPPPLPGGCQHPNLILLPQDCLDAPFHWSPAVLLHHCSPLMLARPLQPLQPSFFFVLFLPSLLAPGSPQLPPSKKRYAHYQKAWPHHIAGSPGKQLIHQSSCRGGFRKRLSQSLAIVVSWQSLFNDLAIIVLQHCRPSLPWPLPWMSGLSLLYLCWHLLGSSGHQEAPPANNNQIGNRRRNSATFLEIICPLQLFVLRYFDTDDQSLKGFNLYLDERGVLSWKSCLESRCWKPIWSKCVRIQNLFFKPEFLLTVYQENLSHFLVWILNTFTPGDKTCKKYCRSALFSSSKKLCF